MLLDVRTTTPPPCVLGDDVERLARARLSTLLTEVRAVVSQDPGRAIDALDRVAALLDSDDTVMSSPERAAEAAPRGGLAPWQARKVRRYMEANLASPVTLQVLATVGRLSTSHFARAFRASFGEPPHAYLMRLRVERACVLMVSTDEPLARIALDCGLADQSHLTRLFRRFVGTSPSTWRRARMARPMPRRGGTQAAVAA
ncbi:helix-turn-helix domain-containing protein [Rhodoplanes roseus]|nr:AraC family transcriptional regulator [Rhodoplanes roseus]